MYIRGKIFSSANGVLFPSNFLRAEIKEPTIWECETHFYPKYIPCQKSVNRYLGNVIQMDSSLIIVIRGGFNNLK